MLGYGPLPGTNGQLRPGQRIGGSLKVLAGGQVALNQRLNALKLATGVVQNGLFTLQGLLIVAVSHLFGPHLRLQVGDLGPGLGKYRLDIGGIQRDQQVTFAHLLPFPYR